MGWGMGGGGGSGREMLAIKKNVVNIIKTLGLLIKLSYNEEEARKSRSSQFEFGTGHTKHVYILLSCNFLSTHTKQYFL